VIEVDLLCDLEGVEMKEEVVRVEEHDCCVFNLTLMFRGYGSVWLDWVEVRVRPLRLHFIR